MTNTAIEIKQLLDLASKFDKTKKELTAIGSYYLTEVFTYLGYKFQGPIENPNILHIMVEAWLLGLFSEIKPTEELKTYKDLLSEIKTTIVSTRTFIENVSVLLSTYVLNESALSTDKNVYDIFLMNLNETKNEMLRDIVLEQYDQADQFKALMENIYGTAINYTLNEFNSAETNKKNLEMLNTFKAELNTPEYEEAVKRFDEKLQAIIKKFHDLLRTDFNKFFEEIKCLNENASSIILKVRKLLSPRNMEKVYQRYLRTLTNTVEHTLTRIKLERLMQFYLFFYNKANQGVICSTRKINQMKNWVKTSADNFETLNYMKNYYTNVYNNLSTNLHNLTITPRRIIYDRVYKPTHNLYINVLDGSVNLIANCKGQAEVVKNNILSSVKTFSEKTKELLVDTADLVHVDVKDDIIRITVSKKLFLIDPQTAANLFYSTIQTVKQINEIPRRAINFTKEKYDQSRNLLLANYHKFLDYCDKEEIASH